MGQTPSKALLQAAEFGNVSYLNRALAEGANVNTRAKRSHDTPLILASRNGHVDIVKILLEKKALDTQNIVGSTPLIEAAKRNHCAVLALLLDYGCDPFRQNSNGKTTLDMAAERKQVKAVRLIEARICSFYSHIRIERKSWFSTRFSKRWVTVLRRRPWDNPSINPTNVTLCIYHSLSSHRPDVRISGPRISNMSRDGMNVTFTLSGNIAWVHGKMDKSDNGGPKSYNCSVSYDIYMWLERVLHNSFITGQSPAFDPVSRCIYMPISATAYARQYTAHAVLRTLTGRNYDGPGNQAMSLPPGFVADTRSLLQPQPTQTLTTGSSITPSRPMAQSLPSTPQYPIVASNSYSPAPLVHRTPITTRQTTTPQIPMAHKAEPTYLTPTMRKLMQRILNGDIDFSEEVPEEFCCPITTDIMVDPVVCSDGHTYSRQGIAAWIDTKVKYALELQQQQQQQGNTSTDAQIDPVVKSPITGDLLDDFRLIPNHLLRSRVLEWVEKNQIIDENTPFENETETDNDTHTAPTGTTMTKGISMSLDLDRTSASVPASPQIESAIEDIARSTAAPEGVTSAVAEQTNTNNPPVEEARIADMNRLDSVALITSDDWVYIDKDGVPPAAVPVDVSDGSLANLIRGTNTAVSVPPSNVQPSSHAHAQASGSMYSSPQQHQQQQQQQQQLTVGVEPSSVYVRPGDRNAATGRNQAVVVPVDMSAFYASTNRNIPVYTGQTTNPAQTNNPSAPYTGV